jgi:pimeloyl-ACP methyl ester carboxylesterase
MRMLDDRATQKVTANGLELACQVYAPAGEPADAAIVLIRGLGTQLIEWSPVLIESLVAGGLKVVIFDNRDVGLSARLDRDYALSDMADDVVALMQALGEARFHVFGISLGGMIAQLVAVQHPQAVRCLFSVMSSTGNPDLPRPSKEVWDRMMMTASTRAGLIELDVENRVVWGSPGYPETEAERRAMSEAVYDRSHYPEGVARQMVAAREDGSRVERLGAITAPALVIHGADDPLVLPAGGEDTARSIPGAELVMVPGMGHNIPHALAPLIAERVLAFIARH